MPIISTNTTWKKGEVHNLTGSVIQIAHGATLTIEGGVQVIGGKIETFGTLNVSGTADSKANFKDVAISLNNPDNDKSGFIDISHANINGGSLMAPTGAAIYGALSLLYSKIENVPEQIYLWYPTSHMHIEENIFINSGGIALLQSKYDAVIKYNYFENQTTPFAIETKANYDGARTVVEFNSFVSTDRVALRLPDGYTSASMLAQENWFGTTDSATINSMIYDRNDSLRSAGFIGTNSLSSPSPRTPVPDKVPPSVTNFSPADDSSSVAVSGNIVVTFSENIARGNGNIVLKTSAGNVFATYDAASSGNITISGYTLTINPSNDLVPGTGYKVEFPVGSIKDLAGNAYAGTSSYNFTTASNSPSQTQLNFDVQTSVIIEEVPLLFSNGSESATWIYGKTYRVGYTPPENLSKLSQYAYTDAAKLVSENEYVAVSNENGSYLLLKIEDSQSRVHGGKLDGVVFTQSHYSVATPPTVISFSPADEATGVSVGSNIVLNFNEAIARGIGNIVLKTTSGSVLATYDAATSSNITISGSSLTLNPDSDLSYGTGYKVEFAPGSIKDTAGNAFAGTSTYNFTTASSVQGSNKLYGTDGNDVVRTPTGTRTGYEIYGQNGDDTLYGGLGNDYFYGGNGVDTVSLSNEYASYRFETLYDSKARSTGINVTGGVQEGTDFISPDVEYLQFSDGKAYITTGQVIFSKDKTDTIAPSVTSFSPADEAIGVSVGGDIVVTFSEAIARGTGNIVLKSSSGSGPGVLIPWSAVVATYDAATSSNLSVSGSTLTLNPSADLAPGASYTVEFSAGSIKDLAGNAFAGTNSYNFTTTSRMQGTSSNDLLVGGSGVTIDGFGGIDTVTYTGNRGSISQNSDGTWMVGSDTLTNIERLQFADKKVALDVTDNALETLQFIGVIAPSLQNNLNVRGAILSLFDLGKSMQEMSQLALDLGLITSDNRALAKQVFKNVFNTTADPDQNLTNTLVNFIEQNGDAKFLATVAGLNINVDLVGLQQHGMEFI